MKAFTYIATSDLFGRRQPTLFLIEDDGSEDGGKNLAALPADLATPKVIEIAKLLGVTTLADPEP